MIMGIFNERLSKDMNTRQWNGVYGVVIQQGMLIFSGTWKEIYCFLRDSYKNINVEQIQLNE